uniref:(S)-ureidoglycine aminohydrolase cupin domain-containing protein n=1 Tax=Cucumis sativus TaxID=3659 RepID=A0A0A0KA57_CUCSA
MANEEEGNNNNNNSLKIIVERNPSQAKLSQLNIHRWPKWGCSAGKYQLKFEAEETCYLVKGKLGIWSLFLKDLVALGMSLLLLINSISLNLNLKILFFIFCIN